jgi:hypothetical protein
MFILNRNSIFLIFLNDKLDIKYILLWKKSRNKKLYSTSQTVSIHNV